MATKPMIDDFSPGYMRRGMHLFPKQGDKDPWRNTQNYTLDKQGIREAPLEDGVLEFGLAETSAARSDASAQVQRSAA